MAEGRRAWPAEPDGWYVEPTKATEFLLEREVLNGPVWDPCCGMGNIVRSVLDTGLEAFGTDLVERPCSMGEPWWRGPWDFLDERRWAVQPYRNIIMNPPYGGAKLAEAFIRHALTLDLNKVCAFVNSKFMFGAGRAAGLFKDHPPLRAYPVTPRPSCPPGQHLLAGGKASGGVENFVWLVFVRDRLGTGTELCW